ncbi:hypothetical protein HDU81_003354 [Chytriomyces hyalinus]|nr:hypothetical protein HDU81_003354 [Chytriomyces hyalinus]
MSATPSRYPPDLSGMIQAQRAMQTALERLTPEQEQNAGAAAPFNRVPVELVFLILCHIHPKRVLRFRRVCKSFDQILTSNAFAFDNLRFHLPEEVRSHRKFRNLKNQDRHDSERSLQELWLLLPETYQRTFAKYIRPHMAQLRVMGLESYSQRVASDEPFRIRLSPSLAQFQNLSTLCLKRVSIEGGIPEEISLLARLETLQLSECQLSGRIPPRLGQLSRLKELHLRSNLLEGCIPSELGKLERMQLLDLSNNHLSGTLPEELGNLENLEVLRIEKNQELSGPIPSSFGNLWRLVNLSLRGNRLSGPIPAELMFLSRLNALNLSGNRLTGTIPLEMGLLSHLQWLMLNDNLLEGKIPGSIGDIESLRTLDLRGNRLDGHLPMELGRLMFLRVLDVRDNHVSGRIPKQFGGLRCLVALHVSGNKKLCGIVPKAIRQTVQYRDRMSLFFRFRIVNMDK